MVSGFFTVGLFGFEAALNPFVLPEPAQSQDQLRNERTGKNILFKNRRWGNLPGTMAMHVLIFHVPVLIISPEMIPRLTFFPPLHPMN